jgi:hypothetical protein
MLGKSVGNTLFISQEGFRAHPQQVFSAFKKEKTLTGSQLKEKEWCGYKERTPQKKK